MARQFNATSKRLFLSPTPNMSTGDGTAVIWIYPEHAPADSVDHIYLDFCKSGGNFRFLIHKSSNNLFYFGFYNNGGEYRLTCTANSYFTQNTWHCVVFTWSTTAPSRELWINGVSAASSVAANTAIDMAGQNGFIGLHYYNNDWNYSANARLAHAAHWNRKLTNDEVTALTRGVIPSSIAAGLQWHYPITGIDDPEPAGRRDLSMYNAAVVGSPAQVNDPPMIAMPIFSGGTTSDPDRTLYVSKATVYSVLGPPGIAASKASVYSVLAPPSGISVSKASVYSVLEIPLQVTQVTPEVLHVDTTSPEVWVTQAMVRVVVKTATVRAYTGSGGIWIGGSGTTAAGRAYEGTGGVWVGGAAITQYVEMTSATYTYVGGGAIWAVGQADTLVDKHSTEFGSIVIDGSVEVVKELSFLESGSVIIAGTAVSTSETSNNTGVAQVAVEFTVISNGDVGVSQVAVEFFTRATAAMGVSQVATEFFILSQPALGSSQILGEFLATTLPPQGVAQVASEFLELDYTHTGTSQVIAEYLVPNWRHKPDFMPMLQRLVTGT